MSDFSTIRKRNIVDDVLEQIIARLASGEWTPGTQIPSENELAEKMGVSRVSVRNALQRLIAWNMLEARVGEGTFVKSADGSMLSGPLLRAVLVSERSITELLQLRRGVEYITCENAALRASEKDLAVLEEIMADMDLAVERADREKYRQLDLQFHREISRTSGISLMEALSRVTREVFDVYEQEVSSEPDIALTNADHHALLDAIRAHDGAAAAARGEEIVRKILVRVESET
ncbi:MAG: FadR family transcriptional regulator [Oscillospiraceae bacterium]|nr:FadR family transcriptional regulator [Oscillospiraceae bacterium]